MAYIVSNLTNDRGNAAANQFSINTTKAYYFQSYRSVVAKKVRNENCVRLARYWDYSKTTSKHLYIWLRDVCGYYVNSKKDVKALIKSGHIKLSNVDVFAIC